MRHYNIPIFIPHLGCPYECIYCDQRAVASRTMPDVSQVAPTIAKHLHTIPPSGHIQVAFFGGSFTAAPIELQAAYLGAVKPFIQSDQVNGIRISTRPDYINEPVLRLLVQNGVKMVELGVQSLDDLVLSASSRTYNQEIVYSSAQLIKSFGLDLGIQLMVGLPQDSYQRDLTTTRQVIALQPREVRIYPTLVIAGTVLADRWARGEYIPLTLTEAVAICKDMFMLFQQSGINVIRMGLHPGQELVGEGVIKAGPFHPSFGELVEQAVFKDQIEQALNSYCSAAIGENKARVYVHPRDISKAVGKKRFNMMTLSRRFDLADLKTVASLDMARDSVGIGGVDTDHPEIVLLRSEFLATRVSHLMVVSEKKRSQ